MKKIIFKIIVFVLLVLGLIVFVNYYLRPKHGKNVSDDKSKKGLIVERTCAIIKPDAVAAHNSGAIISIIEWNKFSILKMRKLQLTQKQAEEFYAVHKAKPFFAELVAHISSGPVIVLALEKENAIKDWRDLMGATDSSKAAPGTLRKMFAESITRNAVHGSDAPETALNELKFFFSDL